jgi:hypothetical protein
MPCVRSDKVGLSFAIIFDEVQDMGNFYVNYTTFGPEREGVAKCLLSMKRKAFVSPTLGYIKEGSLAEGVSQEDLLAIG